MSEVAAGLGERLVEAIGRIHPQEPGKRAAHAKGFLVGGTFTPTGDGTRISRAPHFADPVKVHARFSLGGARSEARDGSKDGRGFGVKFYLPDGTTTDIVGLTLPLFMVRTPDDFIAFTEARVPDPQTGQPDMEKLGAYLGAHPEAGPAIQAALAHGIPASYSQLGYHSIHAYRFTNEAGEVRHGRYHFIPQAGEVSLDEEEAKERPRHYLQAELTERLKSGPVAFSVELELAEDGDAVDDPTAPWPDGRERVRLGILELDRIAEGEREQDGDVLVFDPTRVTDGIETTDDPILQARTAAYRVSVTRRTQ